MKNKKQNRILGILLTVLLCSLLLSASAEAPNTIVVPATVTEIVDRTDLTAEDFLGTWELTKMQMEGLLIPATQLGFSARIVIDENSIQLTDIFGSFNEYETTFEEGFLYYRKGNDRMKVSISTENLLYIGVDVPEFYGTAEDEGSPLENGQLKLDTAAMDTGTLYQFYEKVEE